MTRTLALAGAGLPTDLLPSHPIHNPAGYWESRAVVELDEEILSAQGGSWDAPPDAASQATSEAWLARARSVLARHYGDAGAIVVKDPRLSLLVPLWHEAFIRCGRRPVYVLMVRHPLDVAASLARRSGLPREQGLALWARYTLQAERDTRGADRVVVAYDDLVADWRAALARIALAAGAGLVPSPEAEARIDGFLSPDLRRERHAGGSTPPRVGPCDLSAAYEVFAAAGRGSALDLPSLDACRAAHTAEPAFANRRGSRKPMGVPTRASAPTWLLVTGAPRSGTSLLRAMVHEHPNAALLQEYGLTALIRRIDAIVDRGEAQQEDWDRPDDPSDTRFNAVAAFYRTRPGRAAVTRGGGDPKPAHFEAVASGLFAGLAPGKVLRVVGDEMPIAGGWEDVPLLFGRLPGLRVLVVARNPAEVVTASLIRREAARRGRDVWPVRTVQEAAAQWFAAWQRTLRLKARYGDAVRVVKYEDLCARTAETMAAIYAFLGLAPHTPTTPVAALPAGLRLHAAEEAVLTNLLGSLVEAWPGKDIDALMDAFPSEAAPYVLGDRIDLGRDEATPCLAQGFSFREEWGRWTDGPRAVIEIRHGERRGLLLVEVWAARAFVRGSEPCDVVVRTGWGEPKLFSLGAEGGRLAFLSPAEEAERPGTLAIEILVARPKAEDEPPADARAIGVGIEALRVTWLGERA